MTDRGLLSSPHAHGGSSVQKMMALVCLALLPGVLAYIYFFGWGILIQLILAVTFAIVLEYLVLKLQGRPVEIFLKDGSAIVTALLLSLCLSPMVPWWVTFSGIAFAIVIAKHVYGGLGLNPFNPAMAGYVFVILCFPAELANWPSLQHPGLGGYLEAIFNGDPPGLDAVSGATALQQLKSELGLMNMVSEIRRGPLFGHFAGDGWEWIAAMYALGGAFLLFSRVIRWHLPVGVLLGMFLTSFVFNIYDSDVYASPLFHLCAGGTILCAFFIATDPVTSPSTIKGKLIFGFLVGVIAYVIRNWGAYPDGIAFAVLIANACTPFIEHYTRPGVLGEVTQ